MFRTGLKTYCKAYIIKNNLDKARLCNFNIIKKKLVTLQV
jgi:hypothetical protein